MKSIKTEFRRDVYFVWVSGLYHIFFLQMSGLNSGK